MTAPPQVTSWPISRYIGKFPNGKWVFVKTFKGTHEEAVEEANKLQERYPRTKHHQRNHYRIWRQ